MSLDYRPPASQWVDLNGLVHYVDHGGPADGPLLVCVHGLAGSLLNWAALAPRLTGAARVLAVDLAGFGQTRAVVRSSSVHANQQLLHRFLTEVIGGPAIVVGNSMGGLITTLQADAHPDTVAGAVLIDPVLPMAVGGRPDRAVTAMFAMYAIAPLGRAALRSRRRRTSPEEAATDLLRLCCVDVDRVPAEVVEQHIALARVRRSYSELDEAMLVASRSLMGSLARRRRHVAMLTRMRGPVLLLHGDKDRLVPIGSARAAAGANPSWRFEVAEGVGHVPQLEVAGWTAEHILGWLSTDASAAAVRTRQTRVVAAPTALETREKNA